MPPPPFQLFLDAHREPVLAFLRALVGPDDADDCFQETFVAALRAYDRLDGLPPRAWVMTIARRKAIDHHRARARRPQPRAELPEAAVEDPPPDERRGVWAELSTLAPKQREAVALRYAADLSYAEIAAALDCSREAARRSVHEGLKHLRQALTERGDTP